MPESFPLLEVEELRTHFFARRGVIKAVDGVSFTLHAGETLALVGESGKTTLAKLILLLERPTDGSLLFDGQEVQAFSRHDLARYRRSMQAVFQDPYSSLNLRMAVGSPPPTPITAATAQDPAGRGAQSAQSPFWLSFSSALPASHATMSDP